MNALAEKTIYEQVVEVTYDYLGPAAERFIDRVITVHLGKDPEELSKKDIDKFVDWAKLAMALLTEDTKEVDEFTKNLLAIAKKRS